MVWYYHSLYMIDVQHFLVLQELFGILKCGGVAVIGKAKLLKLSF